MRKKKENKNLTTIEWKIYNYLKERTLEDKWTSQQELIEYLETQNVKIDKRTLRKYIQDIRKCEIIQKVILTSYTYGYRIMSDKEQYEILLKRKISILKSLKQFYKDNNRLELNGQCKIAFDTDEREFIESLLK